MRRNLISRIFFIVFALFLSLMYAGCNTKDKYVEVESIIIKCGSLNVNEPIKLVAEIYPENATNKDVDWYLYASNNMTLTKDGVLTLLSLDASGVIMCIANNGVSAKKNINNIVDRFSDLYYAFESNVDVEGDSILKFAEKYNNIAFEKEIFNQIKERELSDGEFSKLINELEDCYFTEEKLSNYLTIILKVPNVHNLNFSIDLEIGCNYIETYYSISEYKSTKYKTYDYNGKTYLIAQYLLSENDKDIVNYYLGKLDLQYYIEWISFDTIFYSNVGGYNND